MKGPLLLAGALIIGCAAPALADEYYVVQGPSRHCTITTTRPADTEVATQIGPMAFTSRVEAEDRIKQTREVIEALIPDRILAKPRKAAPILWARPFLIANRLGLLEFDRRPQDYQNNRRRSHDGSHVSHGPASQPPVGMRAMTLISKSNPASQLTPTAVMFG